MEKIYNPNPNEMRFERHLLASGQAARGPEANSIGLVGGDLPDVTLWLNGDPFVLRQGQTILTRGKSVEFGNPYGSTGEAYILINGPLENRLSALTPQQEQFRTSRADFSIQIASGSERQVVNITPTHGEIVVRIEASRAFSASLFRGADQTFFSTFQPSDLGDTITPRTAYGTPFANFQHQTGTISASDLNAWRASAAVINPSMYEQEFRYLPDDVAQTHLRPGMVLQTVCSNTINTHYALQITDLGGGARFDPNVEIGAARAARDIDLSGGP